jgi:hypothetical protein
MSRRSPLEIAIANVIISIGAIAFFALTLAALSIWSGYVLSILWGWFLVPMGAKQIGVAHAIGLAAIVNVFMGQRGVNGNDDKKNTNWGGKLIAVIIGPLFALFVGWITHFFM